MNTRKAITSILAVGVFSALATAAYAGGGVTPLPAGTSIGAPGASNFSGLSYVNSTGPELVDGQNHLGVTVFTADVIEKVFKNASGDLTFTYKIHQLTGDVQNLVASSFLGYTTTVGEKGTGTAGSSTGVSNDGFGDVNFTLTGVTSGVSSYLLFISTDATKYAMGNIALQDSGNGDAAGFAPAAPEPATLVAFAITGLGIMLMMLSARRKQTFNQLS
jgi:hypothetical protein